jgi:putative ABC transport system ATP-binding protein
MSDNAIELKGVEKVYRTTSVETVALTSMNLAVRRGEFISIMGPSGCGKSTLLNIMGLLDEPSAGSVSVNGADIRSYRDRDVAAIRNKQIGFVFVPSHS